MPPCYLKLEDATALAFSDRTHLTSIADYVGWQVQQLAQRGLARTWYPTTPIDAEVNHGRWIVRCLRCDQGPLTHPDWRVACCAECGAVYLDVRFPDALAEITTLLLARGVRATQNWKPGEPVAQLVRENREHEVAA